MHTTYERRCIACRQTALKQNLIRVCRVNDEYIIDNTYKALGRSAYICKNNECLKKLVVSIKPLEFSISKILTTNNDVRYPFKGESNYSSAATTGTTQTLNSVSMSEPRRALMV